MSLSSLPSCPVKALKLLVGPAEGEIPPVPLLPTAITKQSATLAVTEPASIVVLVAVAPAVKSVAVIPDHSEIFAAQCPLAA